MTEQLSQAGILLGVGMTVVFAFLTLLIAGIHCIAWFARTFPEPEVVSHKSSQPNNNQNSNANSRSTPVDPAIAAAIARAVNAHRRSH